MPGSSKIFTGYRVLGLTSNHVPLAVRHHEKHNENYVITCVGKAFHTYNCSKLGIVSVSDEHEDEISCVAVSAFLVFTGCRNKIHAFAKKGRDKVHTYEGHGAEVSLLLPFGNHLVAVDESSCVKVWDIESEDVYTEIEFEKETFHVTAVVHPSTYVNKILFGSKQGALQLWNIKTNKMLFLFHGWNSQVCVLEQAPAVDVMGVGLANGKIILHNIKFDETVIQLCQEWGPISSISFRLDGQPIMVTGSTVGHVALWNLEEKRLQSQMRNAHQGAVTGMQCLPNEPLVITSSADNSIKVWIFDQPDGGGRLLRQRSGHSAPPNKVRFYDTQGKNVLSAGQDSTVRSFSTVHDRHNKNLGRASYNKKESKKVGLLRDQHMMPPVVNFSACPTRESDWDSILACHRGDKLTTCWNYVKGGMGQHKLMHDRFKDAKTYGNVSATCSEISSCGNFGVIGYSCGHVDLYNIQSGLYRGSYGNSTGKAHNGPVRGIAVDSLNEVLVTAGADSTVKFWKFKKRDLLEEVQMDSQISQIYLHRESAMLAVALDDFMVKIIDLDTRRIVRSFVGHNSRITDVTFSPDSRWLITSSMDNTLRTWDLPTGRLIDCFLVDAAVTSLSMSPTGDFLTTSHVDDLGVYLWSNKTLYSHVSLRPLPGNYQPAAIELPTTRLSTSVDESSDDEEEDEYEGATFKSPEQISNELVTLSLLPNSRWQNLLHLDLIKMRNKPKQPPKVPKAAPFFLPTVPGLEFKFGEVKSGEDSEDKSRILSANLNSLSDMGRMLKSCSKDSDYEAVMERLKQMGPSAIDSDLRSLSPEGGGSIEVMRQFLQFIDNRLHQNKDFELVQAYLGLYLKLHGDVIADETTLKEQLQIIKSSQVEAWHNLQNMFNQSLCLVNYLKSAVL